MSYDDWSAMYEQGAYDDMPSEKQLQNWNEANDYTHEGEEWEPDEETASELNYALAHTVELGPNDADAAEVQVYGFEATAKARGYVLASEAEEVSGYPSGKLLGEINRLLARPDCPFCGGAGEIDVQMPDGRLEGQQCPTCHGSGKEG